MRSGMKSVIVTIAMLAVVSHAAVAGGLKTAKVDVRKIFDAWTHSVQIQKKIEKARDVLERENNERLAAINEHWMVIRRKQHIYKVNQASVSEEDKKKLHTELSGLQREALALEQDRRDFLKKGERKLANKMSTEARLLLDQIMQAAQVYALEKKYDMVIETGGHTTRDVPFFVHLEGATDITGELIKRLNAASGN